MNQAEISGLLSDIVAPHDIPEAAVAGWIPFSHGKGRQVFFAAWISEMYELSKIVTKPNIVAYCLERLLDYSVSGSEKGIIRLPTSFETGAIKHLEVGQEKYLLLREIPWIYLPAAKMIYVDGLSPAITGTGRTNAEALCDFSRRLHVVFHRIGRKRPFEWTVAENALMTAISRSIDIYDFESREKCVVHRIGLVRSAQPNGKWLVEWEDDSQENVEIGRAPSNFASLNEGEWFEALVRYGRDFSESLEILACVRLPSLEMSESEARAFWEEALPGE